VSAFAPSTAAARTVDPATTIVTRKHPSGAEGAFMSLKEVAHRILEGRLDPRVRAWAIEQLHKGNRPKGHQGKAQAILDGLRRKALYTPDPVNAEFIQAAKLTLCLDETTTLCFAGGDCDDLCVAFGSAAMSIGIPVQVVGQAFDGTNTPTHVICAIQIESGGWLKVDPSSDRWPVGQFSPATGEHWIDPFDEDDKTSGLAGGATTGDYVGVGAHVGVGLAPAAVARIARHWYPNPTGGWHYVDRPVGPIGVGRPPAGLGAGFIHSAMTNAATWIDYGAVGAALGVAGYVVYQLVKKKPHVEPG
jgi:transglutaminase-like putative cysteine protease